MFVASRRIECGSNRREGRFAIGGYPYRAIIAWLLLMLSIPTQAQDETILLPDEAQTVTITADAPAVLLYEARGGEVIRVRTEAQGEPETKPDTVLTLIAPDDTRLAYNDNTRSADGDRLNADAELGSIALPLAGTYRIVVDSFNGVSEGEVVVLLSLVDPFSVQVEERAESREIRFTLPEDATFSYAFMAEADSRWTITVRDTAGALDPYMRVLDEAGEVLASNDDHATGDLTLDIFDARLESWAAPDEGTYTIQVSDILGRRGEILLLIEPVE